MFEESVVSAIQVEYIIAHIRPIEIIAVMKEWYRVLKPDGWIEIEEVDYYEACNQFMKADNIGRYDTIWPLNWALCGGEHGANDFHAWAPTISRTIEYLEHVGFSVENRLAEVRRPWWPSFRIRVYKRE